MDKEELSLEQRIDDVVKYSKLIAGDITNDYYIIPFMNLVIKVIDEKGFLTRQGLFIIHQDIMIIMNKLKEYPCDRDRIRAGLYFTICLNMGVIFISFVRGMEEEEGKKYKEYFTDDLIFVMNQVADRIESLSPTFKLVLENELPKLNDKYAKIFDTEKRECFTKEIFGKDPLILKNKDLPDISSAQEVRVDN